MADVLVRDGQEPGGAHEYAELGRGVGVALHVHLQVADPRPREELDARLLPHQHQELLQLLLRGPLRQRMMEDACVDTLRT